MKTVGSGTVHERQKKKKKKKRNCNSWQINVNKPKVGHGRNQSLGMELAVQVFFKEENKLPIIFHPTKKQSSPHVFSPSKNHQTKQVLEISFQQISKLVCCLKHFRNAIILTGKPLNTLSYTNTVPMEVYEDWRCINVEMYNNLLNEVVMIFICVYKLAARLSQGCEKYC